MRTRPTLHAKTRKSDTAFSTKANVIKLKLQKHALIRVGNAVSDVIIVYSDSC